MALLSWGPGITGLLFRAPHSPRPGKKIADKSRSPCPLPRHNTHPSSIQTRPQITIFNRTANSLILPSLVDTCVRNNVHGALAPHLYAPQPSNPTPAIPSRLSVCAYYQPPFAQRKKGPPSPEGPGEPESAYQSLATLAVWNAAPSTCDLRRTRNAIDSSSLR